MSYGMLELSGKSEFRDSSARSGSSPVSTIGAGSMVGWHVNNSGFWIFTSLYGFDTKQGLKYFTTTNALGGIVAFIVLVIIHAVGLV